MGCKFSVEDTAAMAHASQTYTASDLDALTARLSALMSTFNSTEPALQQGPGMAVVECVEDVGAALVWLVRGGYAPSLEESFLSLSHDVLEAIAHIPPQPNVAQIPMIIGGVFEVRTRAAGPDAHTLCTPRHCRALFTYACNVLLSAAATAQRENVEDEVMSAWSDAASTLCPALMTFFSHHLSLLGELRETVGRPRIAKAALVTRNFAGLMREFMLMLVDEPVLCVLLEKEEGDADGAGGGGGAESFTWARRLQFSGIACNSQLAHTVRRASAAAAAGDESGLVTPRIADIGELLDMNCWTVMHPLSVAAAEAKAEAARAAGRNVRAPNGHRVWREGIPDDIALLNGERVVIFYRGTIGRSDSNSGTFPRIPSGVSAVAGSGGDEFSPSQLKELRKMMEEVPRAEYVDALKQQIGRGGSDGELVGLIEGRPAGDASDQPSYVVLR
eukprot:TRINITY_DN17237_c0_g1_i1.p1 TRINITY_DN17237_c0_g1~~TRINITY_DN17237_c0_g1_i1.p1  ORF type:complete len:446 (+),score=105.99 TRINITY_DN17237_c0_g1_i1:176-1513(+)